MKLTSLSIALLAVAACGGAPKAPVAADQRAAVKPGVPAEWAAVLVEGASFKLDSSMAGGPERDGEPDVVIVTAHDVTKVGDATRAHLKYTTVEGEDTGGKQIEAVQVSPAGVWFVIAGQDGDEDEVYAGPPSFPAGDAKTLRGGDYNVVTRNADGSVCYGWEPGPDAGECEEVCFGTFCVAPSGGIISGDGNWWPNEQQYQQVAK